MKDPRNISSKTFKDRAIRRLLEVGIIEYQNIPASANNINIPAPINLKFSIIYQCMPSYTTNNLLPFCLT